MFVKLLRESVLISAVISLILVGTASYLWIAQGNVPEELYAILGAVIGFYFGTKTGVQTERINQIRRM